MLKYPKRILAVLAAAAALSLMWGALSLAKKPDKPGGGKEELPPVDPSGGVIYFWDQLQPEGDLGGVVKVNPDGTGYERLVNSGVNNSTVVTNWDVSHGTPTFFVYKTDGADGRGIYISVEDPEESGWQRKISELSPFRVALSRNDGRLAFTIGGTIYVADLIPDGTGLPSGLGEHVAVAEWGGTHVPSLTWSPDGAYIALDHQWAIFVVELEFQDGEVTGGKPPVNIDVPFRHEIQLAWSPWLIVDGKITGSRIAFRAPLTKGNGDNIHTILPDGSGLTLAVGKANSEAKDNWIPAWSPDGNQIAFRAHWSNGEALMRSAADGSTAAAYVAYPVGCWIRKICWRP